MCVSALHVCPVPMEARRVTSSETGVMDSCEPHMWELGAECMLSSGGPSALKRGSRFSAQYLIPWQHLSVTCEEGC